MTIGAASDTEQEVNAIRKKIGKNVHPFPMGSVYLRNGDTRSPTSRAALDRIIAGAKKDDIVRPPCASSSQWNAFFEQLHRSTSSGNTLEASAGIESHPLAVGRPKWVHRAFGTGKQMRSYFSGRA